MDRIRTTALMCLAALLAAGCGREGATPLSEAGPAERGVRVWQGVLPCSDCRGVETRLALSRDGGRHEYVLSESYLGPRRTDFDQIGVWRETVPASSPAGMRTLIVLDPGEARERRFALIEDGSLELLEADGSRLADGFAYRLPRR
ncbi:copper resistance protein NlpE N-terminal domain-containing protein [Arenimonas sp.]|uniref:copper resistance protein NlpE N-terminal domain-containing protein n=1 Tax=Arenimonas sp. TaxID=1872635 RepID=UPI0039E55060